MISPPRSTSRAVLWSAVGLSAVVHAALLAGLVVVRLEGPRRRLIDGPATTIVYAPPAPALAPPEPQAPALPITPPEPEVTPAPPPDPAPSPEPVREAKPLVSDVTLAPIAPAPSTPPAPAGPAPGKVEVTAPPPPPATALRATFAGMQGERARRVVYVVDGSGAMLTTMPYLRSELARSIGRLSPSQSFEVVVFRQPPPQSATASMVDYFSGLGLVSASDQRKGEAAAWAHDLRPSGGSVPLAGLTRALEMRPDLIFLLTCSIPRSASGQWGDGPAVTLGELDRLNPIDPSTGRRRTVIKAVQLLKEDPSGLLQAIARLHGDGEGSYRVLGLDELSGR
jgi:hypothetical protein